MQRLATRVEVESLPTDVGALFLLRRADRLSLNAHLEQADPRERALACQIAEQMGGLPLALDQAGAYLGTTGMSLEAYQQVYQQHRRTLHQRRGSLVPDHPDPVATTWKLAFTRVESQNPAAAELLQVCAFLFADAIPEEMLTQGGVHLGPVLASAVGDPFRLGEAISVLRAYSLIHRDPQKQIFSLHRLVQAVVADGLDEATRKLWRERIIHLLLGILPPVQFAHWSAWERLLGHILIAVTWMNEELLVPGVAKLFRLTGWYLSERARYREAELFLEKALAYEQQEHSEEHAGTASAFHTLALLYQEQGKYEQAEPLYQRALRIFEQALGPEHPSTGSTVHELARLYQAQGKYEQAEPLYQRALRIFEQALGPEHPSTAIARMRYVSLLKTMGRIEAATRLEALSK
jgi:tetratricopeptide (TPR) repeat protein